MIFKTVTGEPLFDRTANLFGGIKTRVANAMRRGEPLEDIVPDVSRVFWRSAATEFRAKIRTRETTLKRIEIDLPQSAKALFAQVLRRDIESTQCSVRRQVDTQTYFGSRESRELLQHASYGRVGQVLKTLQAKRRSDSPAPNRFEAAERFLHHLCTLKARLQHNLQLIGTLERMTTPRLSAHEVLLLMFNSVLKSMCHEDWYAFAEDALNHHLPSDDALSLQRDHEMAWKLGFDALRREVLSIGDYQPIRPIDKAWLKLDFAGFCETLAARDGVILPDGITWDEYEQQGWRRQHDSQRLTQLRHAFRRALEMWLVFDMAVYLEAHGYEVKIATFCERAVTPRNILISARKAV